MMKALITLSVFLFIVTCSPISQINQVESTVFDSFSIISIESNLVEIKYKIVGYTKSIPPRIIRREDSYVYNLVFKLSFDKDIEDWNSPIYMQVKKAGNDFALVNYNDKLSRITDSIFPEYITRIEVKKKGDILITLGYLSSDGKILFDQMNPFRTKIITLQ